MLTLIKTLSFLGTYKFRRKLSGCEKIGSREVCHGAALRVASHKCQWLRSASDLIAFNHAGSVSSSVRCMVFGINLGSQLRRSSEPVRVCSPEVDPPGFRI